MHILKRVITISLGLTGLMVLSCEEMTTPPEVTVRAYVVTLTIGSSPVVGGTVYMQTDPWLYVAGTDANGSARIEIPNNVTLPTKAIITAWDETIMPEARTVSGAQSASSSVTISCEAAPSVVLLSEENLYHIGDDNYTGDPNSELQIPAQGIELSFGFNLSSVPSSMPYIRFYARGIEHPTQVQINDITTNTLGNTASDGSLSKYDFRLTADPGTVFNAGPNTLTMRTFLREDIDDWDDLEFCSMILYYP